MTDLQRMHTALEIFIRHEDDFSDHLMHAEHDVIYMPGGPDDLTEEERIEMKELGFHVDDHGGYALFV
jgi:hypothetical protein